jgi:hypothetical protein
MPFPASYCPNGDQVLQRLSRLYVDRAQDIILASMELPVAALQAFAHNHRGGFCDYPDPQERIAFWDACLREHIPVMDDSIPSVYLTEMDQGLYGGLLGGEMRFLCDSTTGWISSMVAPLLRDWSEFGRLSFVPAGDLYQRYLRQLQVFNAGAQSKFGISHFILIDGLNFVFELLGATRTYLSLLEQPEYVARAIELAFELNVHVQEVFFSHVPLLAGGTCSNMAQWLPGRVVSESVDPFHMTSVDYFERWGRAPIERILACFDGGAVHIHGNGRHLLEAVATIKGLRCILLGDDRGFAPAFDVLPQLQARTAGLPLIVGVDYRSFHRALCAHQLPGGVFYRVNDVPDVETANHCMDLVRAYRV